MPGGFLFLLCLEFDFCSRSLYAQRMNEFTFEKIVVNDAMVLRAIGYFNEPAGQSLRAAVKESLANGIHRVILNLEKTSVINSPGITQILEMTEEVLADPKGRFGLVGVSQLYQEVFMVVGIIGQATIFADEKSALEQL